MGAAQPLAAGPRCQQGWGSEPLVGNARTLTLAWTGVWGYHRSVLHLETGWSWGCVTPHHSSTSPIPWARVKRGVLWCHRSQARPTAEAPSLPWHVAVGWEQRAFLAGDSSDLLGSWHRRQRSTQGCPCPPGAVKGAQTPHSGGNICIG